MEKVPANVYFIVNRDDHIVVEPDVREVWKNGKFIWGITDSIDDRAFGGRTTNGHFYINTKTWEVKTGTDVGVLRSVIPGFDDPSKSTRVR